MKTEHPKILVVIPARGGSKGVPKKNIKSMNGKPLIAYSIEQALHLKNLFHRIVVSTEDTEIAQVAKDWGAEVPFLRPMEFATDKAPSIHLVKHAILEVEKQDGIKLDWVLLLQPTNPLRISADIEGAWQLAKSKDCDSVISFVECQSHHPAYMKKIENDYALPLCIEEKEGTRRQDFTPRAYKRDGAIYLCKRDVVIEQNSLWGQKIAAYIIPPERGLGIDSMLDWKLVELMMKERLSP